VSPERFYVPTKAIADAVAGREREVLGSLRILWTGKSRHICCPYPDHDDKHPSWRWDEATKRAYCTCTKSASIFDVVCKMLGITFEAAKVETAKMISRSDLICAGSEGKQKNRGRGRGSDIPAGNSSTAQHPLGCILAAYAVAKRLPLEFLRSLGLVEVFIGGVPAVKIPYFDAGGGDAAVRFRIALDGRDKFRWRRASKTILYGLDRSRRWVGRN
jgi:hypothetical protein